MTRIVTQPNHGDKIMDQEGLALSNFQIFIDDIVRQFNLLDAQINPVLFLNQFTVSTLPSATTKGGFIYVTDESSGEIPAFSDGTNWRRVTDRAIVS